MRNKKLLLAVAAACLFALVCGLGIWALGAPAGSGQQVEVEDCDAEDWKNYDAECGRISPAPKVSKAPVKPATTRRR